MKKQEKIARKSYITSAMWNSEIYIMPHSGNIIAARLPETATDWLLEEEKEVYTKDINLKNSSKGGILDRILKFFTQAFRQITLNKIIFSLRFKELVQDNDNKNST